MGKWFTRKIQGRGDALSDASHKNGILSRLPIREESFLQEPDGREMSQ